MATKKTGLGRGLDALFGTPLLDDEKSNNEIVRSININEIEPNKKQARKIFDEEALTELANLLKNMD